MSGWGGKILVLTLLGFAATDYVITKTLSAADAAKHLIENPNWPLPTEAAVEGGRFSPQFFVTALLLILLGAMFLRGFKEVIGLAVGIVAVYLTLNAIVIGAGLVYLSEHQHLVHEWWANVAAGTWHVAEVPASDFRGALSVAVVVVLIFPKLALGLSGFETGVAVMPLIRGDADDTRDHPHGRIRNTRRMLLLAALIMSVCLLGSSLVVSILIPPQDLLYTDPATGKFVSPDAWPDDVPPPTPAPKANERALAYLAHGEGREGKEPIAPFFGKTFGTVYDASTVVILWFAGASAMAGLLNLVPRYLPRYGMAPEWARATRPLVFLLTGINLLVTYVFKADVTAQSDAYATGVLVLITSACVATMIDKWRKTDGSFGGRLSLPYLFVTVVFVYTTAAVVIEKPVGIRISVWFIVAIMLTSFVSRLARSRELRCHGFRMADPESKLLWDTIVHLELGVLVPHRPGRRSLPSKEAAIRREHRIPRDLMVVFVEVELADASDFDPMPVTSVRAEQGRYVVKLAGAASISHTLAALALEMAKHGRPPEIHFGWTDETPWSGTLGFLLFGEGNVPWMVRELIRRAEPDPSRRPLIIIAGN